MKNKHEVESIEVKLLKMIEQHEITEDDYKGLEKDLQKLTDDYIKKVDEMTDKKEKELFEL